MGAYISGRIPMSQPPQPRIVKAALDAMRAAVSDLRPFIEFRAPHLLERG